MNTDIYMYVHKINIFGILLYYYTCITIIYAFGSAFVSLTIMYTIMYAIMYVAGNRY
jgi:hypothetical protein